MVSISELASARSSVLVVETRDDLRLTLREHLRSCGLAVTSVRSGSEAFNLLRGRKQYFDIVLTDLMMAPGHNGFDILKAAKQANSACYVVVIAPSGAPDMAIQAIRSGASDYLSKPFRPEEMKAVMARLRDHALLIEQSRQLARRWESLTDRFSTIGARLERIETMLARVGSLAGTPRSVSR